MLQLFRVPASHPGYRRGRGGGVLVMLGATAVLEERIDPVLQLLCVAAKCYKAQITH